VALRFVHCFQRSQLRIAGRCFVEDTQQWSHSRPHTRLGRRVGVELAPRVTLLDDAADPLPLLDRLRRVLRAASERRLDRRGQETGLSRSGAIDGLDGDARLRCDCGDRRSDVAVGEKQSSSGVDDARMVRGRPLAPARSVVGAFGSCVLRH
jgi:hypothetical protein